MREKDRRWEKRGGGNCGMNCKRRSRSGKHVLCDAIRMVTSRSASRAAHALLHAANDAPSSMTMVDRSVLEARLAEDHRILFPILPALRSFGSVDSQMDANKQIQHDLFDERGIVLSMTQTPSAARRSDEQFRHRRLLRLASQNLTKEVLFVFIDDGKGVGFVAVLGLLSHCKV